MHIAYISYDIHDTYINNCIWTMVYNNCIYYIQYSQVTTIITVYKVCNNKKGMIYLK